MKIGMTVKGCDMMGLYELAKRQQVNLDNIVMIGVNCGGSVSPVMAQKDDQGEVRGRPGQGPQRKRSTRDSSSSSMRVATRASRWMNSKNRVMAGEPTAAAVN